ncbi:MAG: hypothetical protein ACXWPM_09985 [Bdellovibrionota bacterium]
MRQALWLVGFLTLVLGSTSWGDTVPPCTGFNSSANLPVNNSQVLHWKRTTPNQYHDRAHVQGPVVQDYDDRNGHTHFEIKIGNGPDDTIEVIYNTEFGAMPHPAQGTMVEACGDYITSNAQSGPNPASPDGAIVHWVHQSPTPQNHPSGFVMLNGSLYGQDAEHAGPSDYTHPPRGPRHHGGFQPGR